MLRTRGSKIVKIKKNLYLCYEIVLKMFKTMSEVKRVLFVNSEIFPYLPETPVSGIGRYLPQGIQERGREIRSFMPRYGCVNERKNQLHEVIRLSGMNIIVSEMDRPLVIKVASISAARMQVYFIDNEDYFHRKQTYNDVDGKFFEDNGERAIFFARGVLETVKKLRWAPDIIHCQGWISHILPLYLKKAYKDDPIFANSKVVLSLYNEILDEKFSSDIEEKILFNNIEASDVAVGNEVSGMQLAELAVRYSDGVIFGSDGIPQSLEGRCRELGIPVLPFDAGKIADGSYIDDYNSFYDNL